MNQNIDSEYDSETDEDIFNDFDDEIHDTSYYILTLFWLSSFGIILYYLL
jgi:hypothetical protein